MNKEAMINAGWKLDRDGGYVMDVDKYLGRFRDKEDMLDTEYRRMMEGKEKPYEIPAEGFRERARSNHWRPLVFGKTREELKK